jgi:fumarylacetoacetase
MIAHHTVTGCPMNVGDLIGSGTISGTESDQLGCLLEQSRNGKSKVRLRDGEERTFLEDGDSITITGVCGENEEELVGFGECVGRVEAALDLRF